MHKNYTHLDLEYMAEYFQKSSELVSKSSPLYSFIHKVISKEPALLKLAQKTRYRQPMDYLLLASIHYLLLKDPNQELAEYYPSIAGKVKKPDKHLMELFKGFCLKNQNEIEQLITSKFLQTNAPNRCSYLMPIFSLISQENGGKPLALVEIGTSASLNLYFDAYQYEYLFQNSKKTFGPVDSKVKIQSQIRDDFFPDFGESPIIEKRIGIDQNPLDLTQPENALWLKASIWPDHLERFKRLSAAIEVVQKEPKVKLIKGSTIDEFDQAVKDVNKDLTLIIFHTHVLYQFSDEARQDYWNWLDKLGQERNFYCVGAEEFKTWKERFNTKELAVGKTTYKDGQKKLTLMALSHGHTHWIKWER